MDNKLFFIIYLIIGGIFAGSVARYAVRECKVHISLSDAGVIIAAWPSLIVASMISESTGEDICKP